MTNVRRENGVIKAVYEGIEYIFRTAIEFIAAYETWRNYVRYQAKQEELNNIDVVY
jgi:hypothetical protein